MNAARLAQALRGALVRLAGEEPPKPGSFTDAIEWHRARDRMLTKKEWRELPLAQRQRAFTVANVAQLDLINDVWKAMDKAVDQGTTFEEFKKEVGDKLIAEWKGTVKNPAHRLETIFRTNVQVAYGAGRWRAAKDAVKTHPYWQLAVVRDNRTSDTCLGVAGIVLPADDEWWKTNVPPRHFNCRSTIRSLRKREAERIRGEREKAGEPNAPGGSKAQEGFGDQPPSEAPVDGEDSIDKVAKKKVVDAPKALSGIARRRSRLASGPKPVPRAGATPSRAGLKPSGPAVTKALAFDRQDERLERALTAVDDAHGDGILPRCPVQVVRSSPNLGRGVAGVYDATNGSRQHPSVVRGIELLASSDFVEFNAVHEVGHFIDHQALAGPGRYASEVGAANLERLMAAIEGSQAVKALRTARKAKVVFFTDRSGKRRRVPAVSRALNLDVPELARYLTEPSELFARAYAQLVAIRSGDAVLLGQLDALRSPSGMVYLPVQWDDADFKPIKAAFEDLFEELGWLTRTSQAI